MSYSLKRFVQHVLNRNSKFSISALQYSLDYLDNPHFMWILLLLGHEAFFYVYARKELNQIRAIFMLQYCQASCLQE